jgi:NitT/TauT family transport system permease protein
LFDTFVTAAQAMSGFILAVFGSVLLAIATVYFPSSKHVILSSAAIIKSIPILIFAPIFLIWFGYGVGGKTLLAALVTFLPLLIALVHGFSSASRAEEDLFTMLGATRYQRLSKLFVPKSIPFVIAGLRITAPMAILGSLIAETAGARYGLGITMMIASANQNTSLVFAAGILSAILSLIAYGSIFVIEKISINYIEQ